MSSTSNSSSARASRAGAVVQPVPASQHQLVGVDDGRLGEVGLGVAAEAEAGGYHVGGARHGMPPGRCLLPGYPWLSVGLVKNCSGGMWATFVWADPWYPPGRSINLRRSTKGDEHAKTTRRRAQQRADPARRAVSDHKVHAETRRARADALHAARRVQRIGVASALTDKRVARKLRHATHHASRAASLSISSPRRHRVRNTSIAVVAAGSSQERPTPCEPRP